MCDLFGIRSFPDLKYIDINTTTEGNEGQVYSYSESRSWQMLEKFSLEGGYKSGNYKPIPNEQLKEDKLKSLESKASEPEASKPKTKTVTLKEMKKEKKESQELVPVEIIQGQEAEAAVVI